MQSVVATTKQIGFTTIALTLALAANFAYGQWAEPTMAPPNGNIAAPINVSSGQQNKLGDIGGFDLLSGNKKRSDQYCNLDGTVCATIEEMLGG